MYDEVFSRKISSRATYDFRFRHSFVNSAFLHWFHEIFQSLPFVFPIGIFNEFWWHLLQEISPFLDGKQKAAVSRKITYFAYSSWWLTFFRLGANLSRFSNVNLMSLVAHPLNYFVMCRSWNFEYYLVFFFCLLFNEKMNYLLVKNFDQ